MYGDANSLAVTCSKPAFDSVSTARQTAQGCCGEGIQVDDTLPDEGHIPMHAGDDETNLDDMSHKIAGPRG
jgi:hypothetical protein